MAIAPIERPVATGQVDEAVEAQGYEEEALRLYGRARITLLRRRAE